MALIYVVMGVSGCGKSATGSLLAAALQCIYYDADNYHPEANITKMRSGIPLTDADRMPWLQKLVELLAKHIAESTPAVLACSALKPSYRQLLRSSADIRQHPQHSPEQHRQHQQGSHSGPTQQLQQAPSSQTHEVPQRHQEQKECSSTALSSPIAFVLLNPPRAVLQARLEARAAAGAHFMPASLLESQLQQLQVTDPTELHMCFGCLPGESSCDCSSTEFPTAESIVAAIMSRHHSHSSSADA